MIVLLGHILQHGKVEDVVFVTGLSRQNPDSVVKKEEQNGW